MAKRNLSDELITDEQKTEAKALVIPGATSLRKDETIIAQTETGYLFCKADGIVRFRSDESHETETKGDGFDGDEAWYAKRPALRGPQ